MPDPTSGVAASGPCGGRRALQAGEHLLSGGHGVGVWNSFDAERDRPGAAIPLAPSIVGVPPPLPPRRAALRAHRYRPVGRHSSARYAAAAAATAAQLQLLRVTAHTCRHALPRSPRSRLTCGRFPQRACTCMLDACQASAPTRGGRARGAVCVNPLDSCACRQAASAVRRGPARVLRRAAVQGPPPRPGHGGLRVAHARCAAGVRRFGARRARRERAVQGTERC